MEEAGAILYDHVMSLRARRHHSHHPPPIMILQIWEIPEEGIQGQVVDGI